VVLSYSLYHLFANTQPGARFATKIRQAIAFEQMKTRRTDVIVYGSFEIFETLSFVHLILALSLPVQARLRPWLEHHLPHRAGVNLSATVSMAKLSGQVTPSVYSCKDCEDSRCFSPGPTWCEKCCPDICPP
jgi:hypothetical protein